jgi:two-component system, NtrC family, sensor kinase
MTIRVGAVFLISAGLSYVHSHFVVETQVKQELEKSIRERGQNESRRFQLAQENLSLLRDRLTTDFSAPIGPNVSTEFDQIFRPWNDRTLRNFPQNQPIKEFKSDRYPTAVLGQTAEGKAVSLNPEQKQQAIIAHQLIGSYGAAWTKQFADLYTENLTVNYWQGVPTGLTSKPELYQPKEEYFYIADPAHNPARKPAWTGVYLDPSVNIWMVSAIVPVYRADRFLGVVGHDIVLTDLLSAALNKWREGTTSFVIRPDGKLIAHPEYMDEIRQAQGQLSIESIKDQHLKQIFDRLQQVNEPTVVLDNAAHDEFVAVTKLAGPDWYLVTLYPKSLMAANTMSTAQFILVSGLGALALEIWLLAGVLRHQIATPLKELTAASNQLADGDFTIRLNADRDDELGLLANAFNRMAEQLKTAFEQMENRVTDRTASLQATVEELHRTQAQMVQSEKMSALGQLVAGVAHEINNPIGFLNGSIKNAQDYFGEVFEHLKLYQQHYPHPVAAIQASAEELDIAYVIEDLPKLLGSMHNATDRIKLISTSLRTFSRADTEHTVAANIHDGIDSTLLILKYRLKANEQRPEITIVRDYGELPAIHCFPGQLNQVFMNILANAIEVFDEMAQQKDLFADTENPQSIVIQTHLNTSQNTSQNHIQINLRDNGKGMNETVRRRVFDHLFTTKEVGKGTGLGLSIAHQIIVEKHGGTIDVESTIGQGTQFVITIPC